MSHCVTFSTAVILRGVDGECNTLQKVWSDELFYTVFRTAFHFKESCSWTLNPPNNYSDAIFVLKVKDIRYYDEADEILLPDGKRVNQ